MFQYYLKLAGTTTRVCRYLPHHKLIYTSKYKMCVYIWHLSNAMEISCLTI